MYFSFTNKWFSENCEMSHLSDVQFIKNKLRDGTCSLDNYSCDQKDNEGF